VKGGVCPDYRQEDERGVQLSKTSSEKKKGALRILKAKGRNRLQTPGSVGGGGNKDYLEGSQHKKRGIEEERRKSQKRTAKVQTIEKGLLSETGHLRRQTHRTINYDKNHEVGAGVWRERVGERGRGEGKVA